MDGGPAADRLIPASGAPPAVDRTEGAAPAPPQFLEIEVGPEEHGQRLDRIASRRLPELSRSETARWVRAGFIRVDGRERLPGRRCRTGQRIRIALPEGGPAPRFRPPGESDPLEAEPLALDILHQDSHLVVINKAAGMVVHPGPGHPRGTVANGLIHRYPEMRSVGPPGRPGLVHRLDRGTSGLLLAARSETVRLRLAERFARRGVEKRYLALVLGRLRAPQRIREPIGRDPKNPQRYRCRGRNARSADSEALPREALPLTTLVEVRLFTGRTHQARVHLAGLGLPIAGDRLYGPGAPRRGGGRAGAVLRRLAWPALHAGRIGFRHPGTGRRVEYEAAVPEHLPAALSALREAGRAPGTPALA